MSKIKLESKLTFEGKSFEQIPIQVARQDGLNASFKLYVDSDKGTLLVVDTNDEVLLKIIGDDFTVIPLD